MSVNTCLIHRCLSSASADIRSWFIYELQKSTTIAFSRNSLYTFCSRNPTCGIPPCLRISNRRYLPMPSEFHNREPPLPFGNLKSRPWYSMDIFWNRPLQFYMIKRYAVFINLLLLLFFCVVADFYVFQCEFAVVIPPYATFLSVPFLTS